LEAGAVIVAKVLNEKSSYNQLEDVYGRMSTLQVGDLIVGALGHRNALMGYEGVVPSTLAPGDVINLLNLGGVMGQALSYSPEVGPPFQIEILGQVLSYPTFQSRVGTPANIRQKSIAKGEIRRRIPVVTVVGTCMNSGKTAACCKLVKSLASAGLKVAGIKLTGVSLVRDILAMKDYGAAWAFDFTDTGVVTSSDATSVETAQILFAEADRLGADVIVAETGDGIMGEYGVQAILAHKELMAHSAACLLCANDPVGVSGALEFLDRKFGVKVDVVCGPATDNAVGTRFVEKTFGVPAINARSRGEELGKRVLELVKKF
jgi:hypothetical protein